MSSKNVLFFLKKLSVKIKDNSKKRQFKKKTFK